MTYPTTSTPTAKVPPERFQNLPIVETFDTIQVESSWTGTNAFFIRLAGCDVGRPWCDSKHSWKPKRYLHQDLSDFVDETQAANPQIVVITGGEPLMHDLSALTIPLQIAGLQVNLETYCAHSFSGVFDWVAFSPKGFKPTYPSIYPRVSELKVVIDEESDLQWAEQQVAKFSPAVVKLLQPEWETPSSQDRVFSYVLQHLEWCFSLQTHKFLGVQ